MSGPALSIDHIALRARDARATLSFYSDTLGLPLVDVHSGEGWDGMGWLMMIFALCDGRELALCVLDGPTAKESHSVSDLPHYAFSVADATALNAWRMRLHKAGITFKEEAHGAQTSIYFKDPNGVTLEITAPPSNPGEADADGRALAEEWIAKLRKRL